MSAAVPDESAVQLASLLEIGLEEARDALIEAAGDFTLAIELISSKHPEPVQQPKPSEDWCYEWGSGRSVLSSSFEHVLENEPKLAEALGERELCALQRAVPPKDVLPLLCEQARTDVSSLPLVRMLRSVTKTSNTCEADVTLHSVGWPSTPLHSSSPLQSPLSAPQAELPQREAEIVQGQERLQARLESCGLHSARVEADGNCLFRACAAQLYRSDVGGDHHAIVRHRAVAELHRCGERYAAMFGSPEEFAGYLGGMAELGAWGDELVLRAVADAYGATVHVVTSSEENWYLMYRPEADQGRNLFLAYVAPIHYDGFEGRPLDPGDVKLQIKS